MTPATQARVAVVQYPMRAVSSWDEFAAQCAWYAALAAEGGAALLVFPELLTNQLIPLVPDGEPWARVRGLDQFTGPYLALFAGLARRCGLNVLAGSHLCVEGGALHNVAWFFHRDGRRERQAKLHVTPWEARDWGVQPGARLEVFDTDVARVAILICYDVEFPELARIARAQGAELLLVPYNTDLPSGHARVRTCAHARCVENNVYVALSGMCGGLQAPGWAEHHYARSAILTPCDVPFPPRGVAAEAEDNQGALLLADLDLERLRQMNLQGAVRTWEDRRHDLYAVTWREGEQDQRAR